MNSQLTFTPILGGLVDFEHKLIIEATQERLDDYPYVSARFEPRLTRENACQELPSDLRAIWVQYNEGNPPLTLYRSDERDDLFKIFLMPIVDGDVLDLQVVRQEHGFFYVINGLRRISPQANDNELYEGFLDILRAIPDLPHWHAHVRGSNPEIQSIRLSVNPESAAELARHASLGPVSLGQNLALATRNAL
jgi:hypothetical protein